MADPLATAAITGILVAVILMAILTLASCTTPVGTCSVSLLTKDSGVNCTLTNAPVKHHKKPKG